MLQLPCTPGAFLHEVVIPALAARFLPAKMDTPDARCMLVAIPKQESDLHYVRQQGGPARSLYQFERSGVRGIAAVTQHWLVDDYAAMACTEAGVICRVPDIMSAIETNHVLACQLARLNLFTDAHSLPKADAASEDQAWHCYLRVWRPGAAADPTSNRYAEARARWHSSWRLAVECVHA
jgi:hypothetical protein